MNFVSVFYWIGSMDLKAGWYAATAAGKLFYAEDASKPFAPIN